MTFCILVTLGLHVWAGYLTYFILEKDAGELSSELAESIGEFSLVLIAILTIIVTIVVYLNKKK